MNKSANDTLRKVVNTLFNPFAREDIIAPANADAATRALYHAGGLATGIGGTAFVLKTLINKAQAENREKDLNRLISYSKARYPTVSMSPNIKTTPNGDLDDDPAVDKLKRLHEFGNVDPEIEAAKEAGQENIVQDFRSPGSTLVTREAEGRHDPQHLALAAAGVILGGVGGWQAAEYLADKDRAVELGKRLQGLKNKVDQMTYEEYRRTRGLPQEQKVAALTPSEVHAANPKAALYPKDKASPKDGPTVVDAAGALANPVNWWQTAQSGWWLWAAAAFALSYKASKAFNDKNDPNRQRVKQIAEIAAQRAKSTEAPVVMAESGLDDIDDRQTRQPKLKPKALGAAHAQAPVQAPRAALSDAVPTDSRDPYANLLAQG